MKTVWINTAMKSELCGVSGTVYCARACVCVCVCVWESCVSLHAEYEFEWEWFHKGVEEKRSRDERGKEGGG